MRIEKLELKNFRGFEELSLDFSGSQSVVLVGVNGSGKSSVLDAIASVLAWVTREILGIVSFSPMYQVPEYSPVWHRPGDIYRAAGPFLTGTDIRHGSKDCRVVETISWKDLTIELGLSLASAEGEQRSGDLATKICQVLKDDSLASVPTIVCFPVNRVVKEIPLTSTDNYRFHQLTVYEDAVSGGRLDFSSFFRWYRSREDYENEAIRSDSAHRDPQLEAVRHAVYKMLPEFSELRVRRSPHLAMMVQKHGEEFDLRELSDGEKCLLAMIGDIARRLAIANPGLDNPLEGAGVVLIDEIDLHLHPAWQRMVIPRLEEAFPNCQFIVTTHSPQVLSSARHATLYLLKPANNVIRAHRMPTPFGRDSNTILTWLMEVEERPSEIKEKLDRYFALIAEGRLEEAAQVRDSLVQEIGDDDPDIVRGEAMTRRKEILGR